MERELMQSQKLRSKNITVRIFIIICIFIAAIIISLMVGRYSIQPSNVWKYIVNFVSLLENSDNLSSEALVFYQVRLPRIILAITIGAALSGTGVLFQGIFKNPLASPDILGVTSGCCFGAALGIILSIQNIYLVQISAFVFGMLSILIVYFLSKFCRKEGLIVLVLTGMIVSAFFSAALSFLKYTADPFQELPAIVFWMMGGFHRSSWNNTIILLVSVIPCMVFLILISWKLNIISLGDEEAAFLGINIKRLRFILLIISAFIVSSCVSVSGTVSWVALVMPHVTRLIVGSNHQYSLPVSLFIGGTFTLLMDDIARTLTTSEIPISILTAAVGAPIFGYLLLRRKGQIW